MGSVIIPQNLPVGYRFHPTDEEFVDHYLKNRVLGYIDHPCVIPDVDICRWDPWQLPHEFQGESIIPPDDKVQEWWFFCLQTPQQGRRSTPSGFWKKTGIDQDVKARDTNRVIGTKKILVFHNGRGPKGIKTKWVIHEYHLLANELNRNYVLCWLKHTRDEKVDNSTVELAHGAINLADLDSDLHQPDHGVSFPEPSIPEMMISQIEPPFQLLRPAWRSQNSLPSNINQSMNTEIPTFMDFSLENQLQPENRVASDMLPLFQPAQRSQNSLPSNINQFVDTEHPSFMNFSLENSNNNESIQWELIFGTSEEDEDFSNMLNEDFYGEVEDVEELSGDFFYDDFFDGDQTQTGQNGQTSHSHDERPVLKESRRSGTISVHGVVPLEKKEGMVENKFNGSLVAPEKPMAPLVRAGSVKYRSKDEKPRSEKVKQETATKNIKQESISSDEAAATAKVQKHKDHGSSCKLLKKTKSKEIEHAREKSNSVTALTGPTTMSTKSSTSPRLLNLMNMFIGILLLNAIAKYLISYFHHRFSP